MEQLVKNSLHTVLMSGYSSDGSAVCRVNGMAVFVPRALDGELCEIKIVKSLKNFAYGRLERVLEPSQHREVPSCPTFGACGGCDFLHMDYEEELRLKKKRVEDAFEHIAGVSLPVSAIHGSPELFGSRNKAVYALGAKDGRAVFGFFRERSHELVPVSRCLIQTPGSDRAADAVCRWADKFSVSVYNEATGEGTLRHVFVRTGFSSGESAVCVIAAADSLPHTDALVASLRLASPETSSIVLGVNKRPGNSVLGDSFKTLWGKDFIEETLCGLRFRLSPRSFFQVNPRQAESLYSKVVEFADVNEGCTCVDLYCGTGTISLVLAKICGSVIGAEIVPEAIFDARRNAETNGISNCEFICADAAATADELSKRGIRPDVIVVDPPRKGLSPELINAAASMAPKRIVYVSCDPATLARDIKLFAPLGYSPEKAECFDMFPRCSHIETVVQLVLRNPVTHINIDVDAEELVQDK